MNRNMNADTSTARPSTSAVREWARRNGIVISDRGRIPAYVVAAYELALSEMAAPASIPAPALHAPTAPPALTLTPAPTAAPASTAAPVTPAARPASCSTRTATVAYAPDASPLRVAAISDSVSAFERCDMCNARAYVITAHEAGTLAWCKHHAEQLAIPAHASIVADARHLLVA